MFPYVSKVYLWDFQALLQISLVTKNEKDPQFSGRLLQVLLLEIHLEKNARISMFSFCMQNKMENAILRIDLTFTSDELQMVFLIWCSFEKS